MYAALMIQSFGRLRRRLWHTAVARSGMLVTITLMIVLLVLAVGWRAHQKGQFAKLKTELNKGSVAPVAVTPMPGGQAVMTLQRSQMAGGANPEFLTATLLPGRGMNIFQITAFIPDKGVVNLLASPTLEQAEALLNHTGPDVSGGASLGMGAAFEVPWGGKISGVEAADGTMLTTQWRGHRLTLPLDRKQGNPGSTPMSVGGLLLAQESTTTQTNVMPDGGEAKATYKSDFEEHWVSQNEITTTVQLSGKAMEIKVVARNTGTEAEPMGIGWNPLFSILSGHRGQATLRLPTSLRAEGDRQTGLPTGKLLPVKGTAYDFTRRGGAPLGSLNLDDSFVHLQPDPMDSGPIAELRDPESNYGLRITATSPSIMAIRVYAPADKSFVSIQPQLNYDDPLGHEWEKEDTGMVVLEPGQTAQWRIRLEIFSLSEDHAGPI